MLSCTAHNSPLLEEHVLSNCRCRLQTTFPCRDSHRPEGDTAPWSTSCVKQSSFMAGFGDTRAPMSTHSSPQICRPWSSHPSLTARCVVLQQSNHATSTPDRANIDSPSQWLGHERAHCHSLCSEQGWRQGFLSVCRCWRLTTRRSM